MVSGEQSGPWRIRWSQRPASQGPSHKTTNEYRDQQICCSQRQFASHFASSVLVLGAYLARSVRLNDMGAIVGDPEKGQLLAG
jgi:hypothetical protein